MEKYLKTNGGYLDINKTFIVNKDNPHLISAVEKICVRHKPGEMILLTQKEMDALNSKDLIELK